MTRLIKSGYAEGTVRTFPLGTPSERAPSPERIKGEAAAVDPRQARIAELEAELAARDERIAAFPKELETAKAEAEANGRLSAEEEFVDDRTEALARLESGLTNAQTALATSLDSLEILALLIARDALDKLIGDAGHYHELLAATIGRQASQLEASSLVSIDVSRDDFPDTSEVAALARKIGVSPDCLSVVEALTAGECRIRLTIGSMEVGLKPQWTQLRDLLETMAREDAAA